MYSFYEDLLEQEQRLEWFDGGLRSLRMKDHQTPVSITEDEFNFIYAHVMISSHMHFLSYDMATAFGISALALAQHPFTQVVSIDSYVEEQFDSCDEYRGNTDVFQNADGYKLACDLRDKFSLKNIDFYAGHSPTDVEGIINKYDGKLIRHAFIDAAHFDDDLIADIGAIAPFMEKGGTLVFVHDTHCFTKETIEACGDILHKKFHKADLEKTYGLGYYL